VCVAGGGWQHWQRGNIQQLWNLGTLCKQSTASEDSKIHGSSLHFLRLEFLYTVKQNSTNSKAKASSNHQIQDAAVLQNIHESSSSTTSMFPFGALAFVALLNSRLGSGRLESDSSSSKSLTKRGDDCLRLD
jgi:hypothetical protein